MAAPSSVFLTILKHTLLPRAFTMVGTGRTASSLLCRGYLYTYQRLSSYRQNNQCCKRIASSLSIQSRCVYSGKKTFDNQPPSWLYVSDSIAGAFGAQVNLDLNLENRLKGTNLEELRKNVQSRGIQFNVDVLVHGMNGLQNLQGQKTELEKSIQDFIAERKKVGTSEKISEQDKEKCIRQLSMKQRSVKEELKKVKSDMWKKEEEVMLLALILPNSLHSSVTPEDKIMRESEGTKIKEAVSGVSHVEIAVKFGLIKFSSVGPRAFYLKGDLAKAEMSVADAVCDYLEAHKFQRLSGPEFVKSPIVEACGHNLRDTDKVLTLQHVEKGIVEPLNHLVGVSPAMFAAYVAKTSLSNKSLPLNFFCCGRSYSPAHGPGLFGAYQTTKVGFFSCMKEEDLDGQYEKTVEILWQLLEPFGFHMRLLHNGAKNLCREERRRLDLQVLAPSMQQFVSIASIIDFGDFMSRRLMTIHSENHADIRKGKLVHMVSGTALNITSLLALCLEYSSSLDQVSIPSLPPMKKYHEE